MKQTEPVLDRNALPRIQDYTPLASEYDALRYETETHSAHEMRRRKVLLSLLPPRAGKAADVACGTGRGLRLLRDRADQVVGVDGTLAMLALVKEKLGPGTFVTQANAAGLPFSDATFDLVISLNFLHLFPTVEEKTAFVVEMGRVLKPGGTLIVEFDNALQGLFLGAVRKYLGKDIGYDWPWQIRRCFPAGKFTMARLHGSNLPFLWRVPIARNLDNYTTRFPLNYLAARLFVRAIRR